MLTNKELKTIEKACELLEHIDRKTYKGLKEIHATQLSKKSQLSEKVAQSHKDNAEKHREYNREWARRNREKKKKGVK